MANAGGSRASTTLGDVVPSGAAYTGTGEGWSCPAGTSPGCNDIVAVAAGATVRITFSVTLTNPLPAGLKTITNTVTSSAGSCASCVVSNPTMAALDTTLRISAVDGSPGLRRHDDQPRSRRLLLGQDQQHRRLDRHDDPRRPSPRRHDLLGTGEGWSCPQGSAATTSCSQLVTVASGGSTTVTFTITADNPPLAGLVAVADVPTSSSGSCSSCRTVNAIALPPPASSPVSTPSSSSPAAPTTVSSRPVVGCHQFRHITVGWGESVAVRNSHHDASPVGRPRLHRCAGEHGCRNRGCASRDRVRASHSRAVSPDEPRRAPLMTGIRTRPESLGLAMLLTSVGGFLDAFTFVQHRVFANAQTGNIVLFTVDAANRDWSAAWTRLPPIIAFVAGIAVVETMGVPSVRHALRRPLRVELATEIGSLAVIASLPDDAPGALVTTTVSFVAALQFATFRTLIDSPYTSLLTTGNLRSFVSSLHRWMRAPSRETARPAGRFGGIILAFVVGALVGAITTNNIKLAATAVPSGVLLLVLVWLIIETKGLERHIATDHESPPIATSDEALRRPEKPMTEQLPEYILNDSHAAEYQRLDLMSRSSTRGRAST